MNKILFIVFMFIYMYIVETFFSNHLGVMAGLGFTIGGLWGILTNEMLFTTGAYRGKLKVVVNWIIFIIGVVLTVSFWLN